MTTPAPRPYLGLPPPTSKGSKVRCALDIAAYRQAVEIEIQNIEGGVWSCSVNKHPYGLVTLWNIADKVSVFFFNFADSFYMHATTLLDKAKERMNRLDITPLIVLADGEFSGADKSLPLLHFTTKHMFTYLGAIQVVQFRDGNIELLWATKIFKNTLTNSSLKEMWTEVLFAFTNTRKNFAFKPELFFSAQIEQELKELMLLQVGKSSVVQEYTATMLATAFEMCRLLWNRRDQSDEQHLLNNTRKLLPILKKMSNLLFANNIKVTSTPPKCCFVQTLSNYIKVFEQNPEKKGDHELIYAIRKGRIYEEGTFQTWADSTPKKVIFVPITCTSETVDLLHTVIQSGQTTTKRDKNNHLQSSSEDQHYSDDS